MQVKAADDRAPLIAAMEALLVRHDLNATTRERIEHEIRNIRAGERGERDAAYFIEFHTGGSQNIVTLHDLRLELEGRVAQIDHLVITRLFHMWLCESKSFADGVSINEHGEWSAYYGRKTYAIPSPIEQNKRHAALLADVFDRGLVDLPKRFGITLRPEIRTVVVVSNRARITRPPRWAASRVDGLDRVVKADQLMAMIDRMVDERFQKLDFVAVATLAKAVSAETIGRVGVQLAALHRPGSVDWAARFGLGAEVRDPSRATAARAPASDSHVPSNTLRQRRQAECASCGASVSSAVVAYCRAHSARFGGRVLCMTCQKRTLS